MKVGYLSHPVGAPSYAGLAANIARAKRWYFWLWHQRRDLVVICPWFADLELLPLDDTVPEEREQGLARDLVVVHRCDAIILCGGRISPGMARELDAARAAALEVVDLLHLGEEPPAGRIA